MLKSLNSKNKKQNMPVLNTKEREECCRKCPIFKPADQTCNSRMWLNPNTDEVSVVQKAGYIRGCGCKMPFKWRNMGTHCIAGKW